MKHWPWAKIVLWPIAVVIVWVVIPIGFMSGLVGLSKTPAIVYDLWRTHILGETWALWTDYGAEVTYSPYEDRQERNPPRRQKTQEQCEALRIKKISEARERERWWATEGRPQCLRELVAQCNLEAVRAQGHGMSYAETYKFCMAGSPCGEASEKSAEFICLPVGQRPQTRSTVVR